MANYSESSQNRGGKLGQRMCGCKGIRSCYLCETSGPEILQKNEPAVTYQFCVGCSQAWRDPKSVSGTETIFLCETKSPIIVSEDVSHQSGRERTPCMHQYQMTLDFEGVSVMEDFVSETEEAALCKEIYQSEFVNSQSGRRKQDFGPKVNFKKQKLRHANFTGLPSYSRFLYERMKEKTGLEDFEPVELCNLEYCSERGAHIDPHFDDAWLWGERLVTLNLLSGSVLTFTHEDRPGVEVRVPLPRLSLVTVQASARHKWKHCIRRADVADKRIAMTFRELSDEFKEGGPRATDGDELLKLALSFQGIAVVCS